MNGIICADSLTVLPGIPTGTVSLILTDPPYGLKFMGKAWDKAVPSVAIWRECLRVLKPGAFAFVMCIPRQDCLARMIVNLEDAGFEVGFTSLYWAFASGFPKAMNIGKAVDKRLGAERQVLGIYKTSMTGPSHQPHGGGPFSDDNYQWQGHANITAPATPEAQALDGSYAGFQPKPAVEVVIVAMKPLAHSTYIDQALDNRKGITWLDDGRIPYESADDKQSAGFHGRTQDSSPSWKLPPTPAHPSLHSGRFPANLIVSDDALNDEVQRLKAGNVTPQRFDGDMAEEVYAGGWKQDYKIRDYYGDSGSFSRYFSLDSWWQAKLSELPESVQRTFPFLVTPKAGKKEKNLGCEGLPKKEIAIGNAQIYERSGSRKPPDSNYLNRANHHPTVKPLKLMSYLITLGSRPGDLVLDPFAGTCTTAMAAKILGRDWLMIEIGEEWCQIGRRRVEAVEERLL